jgi:hypothetical protein
MNFLFQAALLSAAVCAKSDALLSFKEICEENNF